MSDPPLDHANHYYWFFGVQAWLLLTGKNQDHFADLPPELEYTHEPPEHSHALMKEGFSFKQLYLDVLAYMRRLVGLKPNVPIWHHSWLDSRLVLKWIDLVKQRPECNNLLVCGSDSPFPKSLKGMATFDTAQLRSVLNDNVWEHWHKDHDEKSYGNVLCHVYRADVRLTRKILERMTDVLDDDAVIGVYIDHEAGETESSNFSWELAQYAHHLFPSGWTGMRIESTFAGGNSKRRLRLLERKLLSYLWPLTWKRILFIPAIAFLWPCIVGLTALNNLRLRNRSSTCPPYCSSALFWMTRTPSPKKPAGEKQTAKSDKAPRTAVPQEVTIH